MSIDHAVEMILAQIDLETPDEHWIQALSDGSHVLIRPLHEEDRQREFEFINELSPDSRRFHFLATIEEASSTLLDQLMDVDHERRMAYVALAHQDGQLKEIGVSRYAALDSREGCECAVVVAEKWQRRGAGIVIDGAPDQSGEAQPLSNHVVAGSHRQPCHAASGEETRLCETPQTGRFQ